MALSAIVITCLLAEVAVRILLVEARGSLHDAPAASAAARVALALILLCWAGWWFVGPGGVTPTGPRPISADRRTAPPLHLRPEALTLFFTRRTDDPAQQARNAAILLADLARRGLLRLDRAEPSAAHPGGEWIVTPHIEDGRGLTPQEQALIGALFYNHAENEPTRTGVMFSRAWPAAVRAVSRATARHLRRSSLTVFGAEVATWAIRIAGLALLVRGVSAVAALIGGGTAPAYQVQSLLLVGIMALATARRFFHTRPRLSAEGRACWAEAQAYGDHLHEVSRGEAVPDLPSPALTGRLGVPDPAADPTYTPRDPARDAVWMLACGLTPAVPPGADAVDPAWWAFVAAGGVEEFVRAATPAESPDAG